MRLAQGLPITCSINASAGFEGEVAYTASSHPKRVVVVGGGPAGMECARIASLRGHKVVLYEQDDKLGGQLNKARVPPFKQEIENLIEYLTHQLVTGGVEVKMKSEFTKSTLGQEAADAIVVCAGATSLRPNLPGFDQENVCSAWDVLSGDSKPGSRVIVIGGGMVGCETAEFLAEKGKKVSLVEMLPKLAVDVEESTRDLMLERMKKLGIRTFVNMKVEKILGDRISLTQVVAQKKKTMKADSFIVAMGSSPRNKLVTILNEQCPPSVEFYQAGDCKKPADILEAIHEGHQIGLIL
jgi:pyruvate/2-oxoglutarate dehydrogenase complex dihydrolipoamide dehydrogenase (E3) component